MGRTDLLGKLDDLHHEGKLPLVGWVFCDVYDHSSGTPWKIIVRDHWRRIKGMKSIHRWL